MPILICRRVKFYSQGDERAFFEFAGGIDGVRKIAGGGNEIRVSVSSRLSDASLRDVLRYKIEMRQLRQFLTPRNDAWFHDERKFWFRKVFED
jgi:hypothetical protein